jgi:WD40 repeat protein
MKKIALSISIFLLQIFAGGIHSSGISQEHFLRIEMGMHTSMITGIGVDAQNQFIVTGSQDKTVRLWELSTGRLVKISRPPIGEDPIGVIDDPRLPAGVEEIDKRDLIDSDLSVSANRS